MIPSRGCEGTRVLGLACGTPEPDQPAQYMTPSCQHLSLKHLLKPLEPLPAQSESLEVVMRGLVLSSSHARLGGVLKDCVRLSDSEQAYP